MPVRNGRTSTRSLRATISAPTIASAAGSPSIALPISASSPSAIQPPTYPPFQPAQTTAARNAPSASSPSPISSGCWCRSTPFALRCFLRLTREGTRGLSVRLLRRRAIGRCFDAAGAFPLAALLQLRRLAALLAVHRLRDRAFAAGGPSPLAAFLRLPRGGALRAVHRPGDRAFAPGAFAPRPPLRRAQSRHRRLRSLRVVLDATALELRDRARELGVLALEVRLRGALEPALQERHLHQRHGDRTHEAPALDAREHVQDDQQEQQPAEDVDGDQDGPDVRDHGASLAGSDARAIGR